MRQFGTAEVSRLTAIPVRSIRAMVRARYVSPSKTARGSLRFSFQDLVLLRTARSLLAARVSPRRVGDALRAVREQLPADLPDRGLSVSASGGQVVVHDAGQTREALSGQLLLAFEVRMEDGQIALIDAVPGGDSVDAPTPCELQFIAALQLEETDCDAALAAYERCVVDHAHAGARANLGRLLHLQGRLEEAIAVYQAAEDADADVLYNLGVALEDAGQPAKAIGAYSDAVTLDPDYADAHHNLARLCYLTGDNKRAVRHWNTFRKLSRP